MTTDFSVYKTESVLVIKHSKSAIQTILH